VKALLLESFGAPPALADVPEPACPPHGVVVRVEATGLCRSDWHAIMGHDDDVVLPHVPGHEFAGVVAEVGADVDGWAVGNRVTAPFVNACGTCPQCLAGDQQVCARQTQPGFTRWGSFAELVVVDHAAVNLVALPPSIDAVTAAGLGCRFATAFRAVVEVGRVRAGEWVAVHGCGGVGLSAVMIARACGARVVAVDVAPAALELATRFGAEAVVDARSVPDVAAAVRDAAGGGVRLSLDALGSEATCAASIGCLERRGRHVQVGLLLPAVGLPRVPMHLVVAGELEVLGSHGMAARSYPAMLGLVASGRLDPSALVSRTVSLAEAGPLLAAMGSTPPTGVVVAVP
jgi:D-arabinose 1-dehydrogenase-like Zn-dependent alcohol dehydrogenase